MTPAYIIDAVRTPRGIDKAGKGALADMHREHLAASVLKAIAERNNLNTADVDDIIWSTTCGTSTMPFAVVAEKFLRDLKLDRSKVDVWTNSGARVGAMVS
jgi:hypothetical protein